MEQPRRSLRSYVDPSTNEMLVADFDLPNYLNWAKGRPVSGSRLLANFLHEWTHRWCFDSRVGAALAFLRLRAGTRLLLGHSAFDDYVRSMTAMTLLEPMAEGLSSFAEYDAYPGESSFSSQTLVASTLFFSPAADMNGRPESPLQLLLQRLRLDPELVERKAGSIFVRVGFNPYSIGYFSVKSLWKNLSASCKLFSDRDLFLSYLRSYIYDDPGLVIALLKEAPDEVRAAENIANHLLERIVRLLSFQDLDDHVRQWIQSAEKGEVDVSSIGSDLATKLRANALLEAALVEDFAKGGDYEQMATWIYMTLEERAICVLGKMAVDLEAAPANKIRIINKGTRQEIYTTQSPGLPDSGEGQLYIVAGNQAHGLLSIVHANGGAFLVSALGSFTERDLELAKRLIINQPISNDFFKHIGEELERDDIVNTVWMFLHKRLEEVREKIYGPLCTLNAEEGDWPEAFAKILELGLYGMLGHDAELTRAVAGVSLLNSITLDRELIALFAAKLEIDSNTLQRVLEIDTVQGLPVMAKIDNSVLALV